jgi:hypothetical protein
MLPPNKGAELITMTDLKAFQVEVTSPADGAHQVFFIASETGEDAVEALTRHPALLPGPTFKLQRRLSDSEIDLYQIGPGTIFRYL